MADTKQTGLSVSKDKVGLAVCALVAHVNDSRSAQPQLYETHDAVWLQVTMKKIPPRMPRVRKIALPHPFLPANNEICLITKDGSKLVKEKLLSDNVKGIAKVISLKKLRAEFKTYKLKRQLAESFDTFLCDDRIYSMALRSLGKTFNKREPLPVRLTYKDWKTEISKTLACTTLRVGHGSCSTVRVGHSGMTAEELSANIVHASRLISNKLPGGSANVKSLFIKTSASVALPIYRDLHELVIEQPAPEITASEIKQAKVSAKVPKDVTVQVTGKVPMNRKVDEESKPKVKVVAKKAIAKKSKSGLKKFCR